MNRKLVLTAVFFALAFSTSCNKDSESDDIAKAQQCLDQVPESAPSQAMACLDFLKDYSSQQSDILRCSIYMTAGGLIENKEVKAYNALVDTTQTNKAASFMAALSLDYHTVDEGYTRALQADPFCQSSGVPGLQYISGVIVAGTAMAKTMADLVPPIPAFDINDPASINAAVNQLVSDCGGNAPNAHCADNAASLGSAAVTLSGTYCATADANPDICGQVTSAINAAGGDPATVGQAMFCYMNHKTYVPGMGCQ